MYRRARLVGFAFVLGFLCPFIASAQMLQPTPAPAVSAENEPWYLNGEPITYGGNFYYPAGAQVFFNPNEMVRSGFYQGIPLYTRTTVEPFSVVYVPLSGGLMQPYERGRIGELAGTSGSRAPGSTTPYRAASEGAVALQAPASPTQTPPVMLPGPRPPAVSEPEAVGTTGRVPAAPRPMHVRIGGKPRGINGVFIQFQGQRWLSTGHSLELDPARMEKIGEYSGFDVWAYRGDPDRIYVPVAKGATVVVPYSRDKRNR